MAALDTAVTALTGAAGMNSVNGMKVYSRTIDFSVTNLASGDWFKLFTLPVDTIIKKAYINVLTAEAGNITLGITGALTAVSTTLSVATAIPAVGSVSDYIVLAATPDIVVCPDALLNSAKVQFVLVCVDLNSMSQDVQ